MNRRAKRNKYKKLQRELKAEIESYKCRQMADAFARANSKEIRTQMISSFVPLDEFERTAIQIDKDELKRLHEEHVAKEILKHNDFFQITDIGCGYRYDLEIVHRR